MPSVELHCISKAVPLSDGKHLALSVWCPQEPVAKAYPVVLITTRYWRAYAFKRNDQKAQIFYPLAVGLAAKDYRLAVADARGTGASSGMRLAETDAQEIADLGELIQWVAEQKWCDGRVATTGCSYSAITTLYSLVNAPDALKLGVCRAPDFDMYRHLFAPGGIVNRWFIESWGAVTAAQDANNVEGLFSNGYWPEPEGGAKNLLGVLPIDDDHDGSMLARSIQERQTTFNIANDIGTLEFIDGFITENNPPLYDPAIKQAIEKGATPCVVRCGWHDAGTALGALALYNTFAGPFRVTLGPLNHEGTYLVDPFQAGDGTVAERPPEGSSFNSRVKSLDQVLKDNKPITRAVEYFTLGKNRWNTTTQWPLSQTQYRRWYLSSNHQLTQDRPSIGQGDDIYQVDNTATTGRFNRWYAQSPDQPVLFPDRQQEDKKLLVYDTPPLAQDTEITGHPLVSLWLSSSASDGHFFAYLETIDPDGRVRLLTEGQLRGLHRKVSTDTPPYHFFGPYHSLKQQDAEPLVPNAVTEISFDLLPISVWLKKGQRIRLAIAGADADTFDPLDNKANLRVERNAIHASYIELPIIPYTEPAGDNYA